MSRDVILILISAIYLIDKYTFGAYGYNIHIFGEGLSNGLKKQLKKWKNEKKNEKKGQKAV